MDKKTKKIKIGNIFLGGNSLIVVQSMTNTDTRDVIKTVEQIKKLEKAGCELVRCSIPNEESAYALKEIKKQINIPIIGDIHFNYKLALLAITNGADKIRINPGNMRKEQLKQVIDVALEKDIAIRIGVNAGSLKEEVESQSSKNKRSQFMVEKALDYVDYFEKNGFKKLVVSLKSSDVSISLAAYKLFSQKSDYPLHLGITEAGSIFGGIIKSSIGLALILYEGLGDTIRVSLSEDPVWEIFTAYNILASLGLRQKYPNIISCPTCARTTIDVISLVKEVEELIYSFDWSGNKVFPVTIAVMGCVVNGPGEAKEADFGVSGAGMKVAFFQKGKIIKIGEKEEIRQEIFDYLSNINR